MSQSAFTPGLPLGVVLIGLRGAGKSTIGAALAQNLSVGFEDLDCHTACRLGCASAGEALRRYGEAVFREAEAAALESKLATKMRCVLALGGGTPTAPGAARLLTRARENREFAVIYLHASPADLSGRLARSDLSARPALTSEGTLGEIGALYRQRDPIYRSLADAVVETAHGTVEQIVGSVLTSLHGMR